MLAALLPCWGCSAHSDKSQAAASQAAIAGAGPQQAAAARREPSPAEARVRELQEQLAERDRQIAAVRTAIGGARMGADAQAAPTSGQAPAPQAEPASAATTAETARAGAVVPLPIAQPAASQPSAAPAAPARADAADAVPASPGEAAAGALTEQRLAEAQKRITRLQRQLAVEVKRRQDVEAEMTRLLQETSASPFEHADNVVEEHLREELGRARKEIADLRTTLTGERRERDEIERRYSALQAQVRATASTAPSGAAPNEELEALQERQRRVLASIQQDLAASKQREAELRQSIEQSQGADAVSAAAEVTNLRSENSALQMRLDEEHRRNGDLSAKLQLATRVTDLIFRMQSNGAQAAQPVVAVPVSDAR